MTEVVGNIADHLYRSFQGLRCRIGIRKLILAAGCWMLGLTLSWGQCSNTVNITFTQFTDDNTENVVVCGEIGGGGENDIDIYQTTGSLAGATYRWEWSAVSNTGPWTVDPYTGQEFVVSSFSSTPGTYYFRLRLTTNACLGGVYSDVVTLTVTGSSPTRPTGVGASRCDPGTLTLTASGCSTYRWYTAPFAGTQVGTASSYTTPSLSTTTTYYVACRNGTCESPRTAVVATIGAPGVPGAITGPSTVCPGQSNVPYSIPSISGVTYNWSYIVGSGATITGSSNSVTVSFSGGATSGTLSVTTTSACGTSSPSNFNITVGVIPAPIVGSITQPTCATPTGSVVLSGLPATGTWTLTRTPGGTTTTGTGTSTTVTGIPPGTYTYRVTNASGCISGSSGNVVINPVALAPAPPTVGTITNPTCTVPTGSVQLTGLPTPGNWTLTRTPGGNTYTNSGSSFTVTGLATGTYTFTVTNSSGCISQPSANVVIGTAPGAPSPPSVGTITQPNCVVSTGSVILNGLPPSGAWTITRTPGGTTYPGSGTTTTITLLPAGTYTFTVTDALGCISGASANVVIIASSGPPAPLVGTITQPTCAVPTGSVDLNGLPATGTWTLTRTPGGTTTTGTGTSTTVTGIPPSGTYTYRVTDALGCVSGPSANVIINAVPAAPSAPAVGFITQPTCPAPTGRVILNGLPAGGWTINPGGISGSTSSTTITGLAPGATYNFTVTDALGCTSVPSANVVINSVPATPAAPTRGTITQPTCALATGSVVLSGLPSGNWIIDPGSYSGAGSFRIISGLIPGTYNFTVTTFPALCTSLPSLPVVINAQPSPPSAPTASVTVQPTCPVPTGTILVTAPVGAFDYRLDAGAFQASPTFTLVSPGPHNVYVRSTTDNTCVSAATPLTVDAVPPPPVTSAIYHQ